ncbi:TadE family type IV pilus minor pilin [Lapillicoccus jejuensis]|uniref:TadE-like protein n=1 Tax=Lapillicoccus jejuensis TaxID=402171 RepID=A0A542DXQ7_9MICO|nr:TadE family type IV pilus minor pilin [Lapillicoccus jejuensis]TQJ07871.1 hypothetical protein FB458_0942 [Lapillicoccus jejuensis]
MARRDGGMVTAELAVALPAVVLVLAVLLGALSVGADQVRCVDASSAAARSLARGEPTGRAVGLARSLGPHGAAVAPAVGADLVTVRVSARRNLPLLGWSWTVGSTSVAAREDVVAGAP